MQCEFLSDASSLLPMDNSGTYSSDGTQTAWCGILWAMTHRVGVLGTWNGNEQSRNKKYNNLTFEFYGSETKFILNKKYRKKK